MNLTDLDPWMLIPVIFFARVLDVSMGTVRTILLIRGHSIIAAGIGFVEVFVWIVAVGQVLSRLDAWYLAVSYAAGFSMGHLVGAQLESKIALGLEIVRIVSENTQIKMGKALRELGYSIIELQGSGERGTPVEIVFVVEKRRRIHPLMRDIEQVDPRAYCTVSDIKRHSSGALLAEAARGKTNRFWTVRK